MSLKFGRPHTKHKGAFTMDANFIAEFPNFRLNANPDILKRWREIFRSKPQITVPTHSVIAEQGRQARNLYYINSGLIEYTYTGEDGRQNFFELLGDYCIFPLQPIFGHNANVGTFIALENCALSVISAQEVYEYLRLDNELALELLAEFAQITGGHIRQIGMSISDTTNRVEQILCLLAEYRLKHTRKGDLPVIGLGQADLARIAKTTRVTITKILGDLKQKHIIRTTYGGLIVTDMAALRRAAGGET